MAWRAFVSLSEGKISICSLTVSRSVEAAAVATQEKRIGLVTVGGPITSYKRVCVCVFPYQTYLFKNDI